MQVCPEDQGDFFLQSIKHIAWTVSELQIIKNKLLSLNILKAIAIKIRGSYQACF